MDAGMYTKKFLLRPRLQNSQDDDDVFNSTNLSKCWRFPIHSGNTDKRLFLRPRLQKHTENEPLLLYKLTFASSRNKRGSPALLLADWKPDWSCTQSPALNRVITKTTSQANNNCISLNHFFEIADRSNLLHDLLFRPTQTMPHELSHKLHKKIELQTTQRTMRWRTDIPRIGKKTPRPIDPLWPNVNTIKREQQISTSSRQRQEEETKKQKKSKERWISNWTDAVSNHIRATTSQTPNETTTQIATIPSPTSNNTKNIYLPTHSSLVSYLYFLLCFLFFFFSLFPPPFPPPLFVFLFLSFKQNQQQACLLQDPEWRTRDCCSELFAFWSDFTKSFFVLFRTLILKRALVCRILRRTQRNCGSNCCCQCCSNQTSSSSG